MSTDTATAVEGVGGPSASALGPAARRLVAGYSIEIAPGQVEAGGGLRTLLPVGTQVYLPFLPGSRIGDSARACRALLAQGMCPVPHFSARAIPSSRHLSQWLGELEDAGADRLLLIAGDADRPAGPYAHTMAILDSGLLARHGFRRLGFAGHPEGHRVADAAEVNRALGEKIRYARETGTDMWIVSQFTFSAEPILEWLARLQASGLAVPVRIGVAGPVKLTTLLKYALRCGVTPAARYLGRHPGAALKLLSNWTPASLLNTLAARLAGDAATGLPGIHIYPFGGVRRSIQWLGSDSSRSAAM